MLGRKTIRVRKIVVEVHHMRQRRWIGCRMKGLCRDGFHEADVLVCWIEVLM